MHTITRSTNTLPKLMVCSFLPVQFWTSHLIFLFLRKMNYPRPSNVREAFHRVEHFLLNWQFLKLRPTVGEENEF